MVFYKYMKKSFCFYVNLFKILTYTHNLLNNKISPTQKKERQIRKVGISKTRRISKKIACIKQNWLFGLNKSDTRGRIFCGLISHLAEISMIDYSFFEFDYHSGRQLAYEKNCWSPNVCRFYPDLAFSGGVLNDNGREGS